MGDRRSLELPDGSAALVGIQSEPLLGASQPFYFCSLSALFAFFSRVGGVSMPQSGNTQDTRKASIWSLVLRLLLVLRQPHELLFLTCDIHISSLGLSDHVSYESDRSFFQWQMIH